MSLDFENIVSAIFSLILIIVIILIGLIISLHYFRTKRRTFLLMGMAWVLLSMLWWSSVINVFLLIINPDGIGLTGEWYFFFTGVSLPICFFFFVTALTDLTFNKYQRYFQLLVIIIGVIYYVVSFSLIFTQPRLIIIKDDAFGVKNSLLSSSFLIFFIIMVLFLGITFAVQSMKSENHVVRVKGTLLLIALILFPIGGFLDFIPTNIDFLDFLDRVLIILSAIIFYFGFIMPDWLKTRISKKED